LQKEGRKAEPLSALRKKALRPFSLSLSLSCLQKEEAKPPLNEGLFSETPFSLQGTLSFLVEPREEGIGKRKA